jgi:hypothetical protein
MIFPSYRAGLVSLVVLSSAATALASPTMVRLGYANCSACHLAPLGAGLLTDYGKGIDGAQSLKVSEYDVPDPARPRTLRYDVRLLTTAYKTTASPTGARPAAPSWLRTYFRGSAALGTRNRLYSSVVVEAPAGPVSRLLDTRPVVEVLGAWEYRHSDRVTLSVSRDRLPRGVEVGETRTVLQDREVERYPAQVRALLAKGPVQFTAYGYGPGSEPAGDRRSHGAGVLGEVQALSGHVVLGGSARRAFETTLDRAQEIDRQSIGAYARLGFGNWGVLAEHEFTARTAAAAEPWLPDRVAGYTQVFFAPREWLITSVVGEQVLDDSAARPRMFRWRPEVQARLSSHFTITASVRTDETRTAGGATATARTFLVQAAVKSVQ